MDLLRNSICTQPRKYTLKRENLKIEATPPHLQLGEREGGKEGGRGGREGEREGEREGGREGLK